MPTATEQLQRNLDRIFTPINRASNQSVQITLDQVARKQQQEDEIRREGRTDRRMIARDKQMEDRQRKQKLLELAARGIKLPENATDADIADAEIEHRRNKASAVIGLFGKEREDNEAEQDKTYNEYIGLVSKSASIDQKRQALRMALANPALADVLSKKQMARLDASLVNGDPEKAIAEVASAVGGDYWFFKGKNPAKAQAIIDAFQMPLVESLTAEKQLAAKALYSKLEALQTDSRQIQKNLFQAARDNAEYLSPKDMAKIQYGDQPPIQDAPMAPLPMPDDPNEVMATPEKEQKQPLGIVYPGPEKPAPPPVPKGYEAYADIIQNRNPVGRTPDQQLQVDNLMAGRFKNMVSSYQNRELPASKLSFPASKLSFPDSSIPKLQAARQMLASLPPEVMAAMKKEASERGGVTPQQIAEGDKVLFYGDLNDEKVQNSIMSAVQLLNIVTGNIGAAPVPNDAPLAPLPQ